MGCWSSSPKKPTDPVDLRLARRMKVGIKVLPQSKAERDERGHRQQDHRLVLGGKPHQLENRLCRGWGQPILAENRFAIVDRRRNERAGDDVERNALQGNGQRRERVSGFRGRRRDSAGADDVFRASNRTFLRPLMPFM